MATAPDLEAQVEHAVLADRIGEDWMRGFVAASIAVAGIDRDQLAVLLGDVFERLRDEGRDDLADLVLGAAESLAGWGSVRPL